MGNRHGTLGKRNKRVPEGPVFIVTFVSELQVGI